MDRSQLLRGALDAATLAVVAEADGYGYDVLRRLRAAGLDEGPHRRYYGITSRGREQLAEARAVWGDFSRALSTLLAIDVEVTA